MSFVRLPDFSDEHSFSACCLAQTSFSGRLIEGFFHAASNFQRMFNVILAVLGAAVSAGFLTGCSSSVSNHRVHTAARAAMKDRVSAARRWLVNSL